MTELLQRLIDAKTPVVVYTDDRHGSVCLSVTGTLKYFEPFYHLYDQDDHLRAYFKLSHIRYVDAVMGTIRIEL